MFNIFDKIWRIYLHFYVNVGPSDLLAQFACSRLTATEMLQRMFVVDDEEEEFY